MLAGVGTDILSIERMRLQIASPAFMRGVFTSEEISAGGSRSDPADYYAKVFAAKEAVFKCFGIVAEELGSWLNIEVKDSDETQPTVLLAGSMAELARARKVEKVLLSLSSETEYAVAFAAAVKEAPR
ncbi:MAG: holo-ACP synthase [Thermoleophilia bacterium]|nr:holo-ACP synthase [Thermoleophilia bacterium]